ncbi:NUDIX domain-containing protein [Zunongwangia sp.]|uniref:NUDIX domain-containing protein n=1 Tax=Zunongwangia sp. TaxID=1965325 RepID=UPI003AA8BE5A
MRQNIAITVDSIILCHGKEDTQIALIQRKNDPYKDYWAIPGGFVEDNEELMQAATRELEEESGLKIEKLRQVGAFGSVDRDPRGRVISIAFFGVCNDHKTLVGSDDAEDAAWFDIDNLPKLAFDHAKIISVALQKFLY